MAAFTSLSSTAPQPQVHSRSCRVRFLLMRPQAEQHFEDGSKRPIRRMVLPYQPALYSSMVTNTPHPASVMERASWWFFTMPAAFKSSIAIDWFSRISFVDVLCRKSRRWPLFHAALPAFAWCVCLCVWNSYVQQTANGLTTFSRTQGCQRPRHRK
jgi:hypothetical protein